MGEGTTRGVRNPILSNRGSILGLYFESFWVLRLEVSICLSGLFGNHFLYVLLNDMWTSGSPKPGLLLESVAKHSFPQKPFFSVSDFISF